MWIWCGSWNHVCRNVSPECREDGVGWYYPTNLSILMEAPRDFVEYMGLSSATALDYSYDARAQVPQSLADFAGYCVEAAHESPEYCPFSSASMTASDPVLDLTMRINATIAKLTQVPGFSDPDNVNHVLTFHELASNITQFLGTPQGLVNLAQTLENAERIISGGKTYSPLQRRDTSNLTYSSLPGSTTLPHNDPFSVLALSCLDSNLHGIDTPETFTAYLYNLFQKDPLLAYGGFDYAACLSWPNLTAYDIERWNASFPTKIKNKVLVVPGTNDPSCSFAGGLSSYRYIGPDNANLLVHDGVGHCTYNNPNPCTTNAIRDYFTSGKGQLKYAN
jgi:hypothetical protein